MAALEPHVQEVVVPLDFPYNYRVGQYIERYIKGLSEEKIMAVKCPSCSKVVVPPRKICGECNQIMGEWVEVGPEGTVENYTIGHVRLEKGLLQDTEEPEVIALIKLDGATSLLAAKILGVDPKKVELGMRVKAIFKKPPEDSLNDLEGFEPLP